MIYEPGQVKQLVETFVPHSQVVVEDLTGTRDHYKVVVVSHAFDGKSLVDRHQMVNMALKEPLKGPIHALTIEAYTPAQWQKRQTQGFGQVKL